MACADDAEFGRVGDVGWCIAIAGGVSGVKIGIGGLPSGLPAVLMGAARTANQSRRCAPDLTEGKVDCLLHLGEVACLLRSSQARKLQRRTSVV